MNLYLTLKAIHVIAVISWMVGLLYLPRLFVYHVENNSPESSKIFKVMEKRLMKIIMNPAMIITWLSGLSVLWIFHSTPVVKFVVEHFVLSFVFVGLTLDCLD